MPGETENLEPKSNVTPETTAEPKMLETEISKQALLEHPDYKKLEEKLTDAESKMNEYWDKLLRQQAELENLQRRTERDVANAHKFALEKFANELLVIVDNLERTLSTKTDKEELKDFYLGVELTLKLFLETLEKFGIKQIDPQGQPFNHEQHTAISVKPDPNVAPNTVLEVVQKGYWLKERLLRPAMVVVSN